MRSQENSSSDHYEKKEKKKKETFINPDGNFVSNKIRS